MRKVFGIFGKYALPLADANDLVDFAFADAMMDLTFVAMMVA